jgi:hypothetical protein
MVCESEHCVTATVLRSPRLTDHRARWRKRSRLQRLGPDRAAAWVPPRTPKWKRRLWGSAPHARVAERLGLCLKQPHGNAAPFCLSREARQPGALHVAGYWNKAIGARCSHDSKSTVCWCANRACAPTVASRNRACQ